MDESLLTRDTLKKAASQLQTVNSKESKDFAETSQTRIGVNCPSKSRRPLAKAAADICIKKYWQIMEVKLSNCISLGKCNYTESLVSSQ